MTIKELLFHLEQKQYRAKENMDYGRGLYDGVTDAIIFIKNNIDILEKPVVKKDLTTESEAYKELFNGKK